MSDEENNEEFEEEEENVVILTEENKEEVADLLGYPMITVNEILSAAEKRGFKGVRLPILKH